MDASLASNYLRQFHAIFSVIDIDAVAFIKNHEVSVVNINLSSIRYNRKGWII